MENKEGFDYRYSADQQQEVENIRKHYLPPEENKMAQLRSLHNSATQKARAGALTLGVIGALIMGSGMSLVMTELAVILGLEGLWGIVLGIVLGLVGMVLVALAYPAYNRILQTQRRRIAPQILQLTEELMQ